MNDTKQRIADSFERHVQRFGYAKTTLDEVAAELRISKKTIYVHFDGKADIYRHVVEARAGIERGRMRATIAALPTRRAQVEALLRFVVHMARTHIDETSEAEWMEEFAIAADAFRKAHGDLMRSVVAEGIDAGEFPAGDADFVEKMVAAMVLEYLVLFNAAPGYDRDDELVERTLRFIG